MSEPNPKLPTLSRRRFLYASAGAFALGVSGGRVSKPATQAGSLDSSLLNWAGKLWFERGVSEDLVRSTWNFIRESAYPLNEGKRC